MYAKYMKRLFDIAAALILSPFVFLLIVFIAPIIYFSDKGSIFYCAKRIGKDGKIFKMYKLRTMVMNAPDIRLPDGSTYNSENDARVTGIGKILRKMSFDELPQIINVLTGSMSMIGPRPDPPDWLGIYTGKKTVILKVRPGITGYNQAYFRNSADAARKIESDIFYALNCNLKLDAKIFIKTVVTIFRRENLYKENNE